MLFLAFQSQKETALFFFSGTSKYGNKENFRNKAGREAGSDLGVGVHLLTSFAGIESVNRCIYPEHGFFFVCLLFKKMVRQTRLSLGYLATSELLRERFAY